MRAPRVQCEQAKNRGWRSGSRLGHVIGMIARLRVTSGHLIGCLGKRCVPTFHAVQRPLASLGLPPWVNWDPLLGIRGLLHRSESFFGACKQHHSNSITAVGGSSSSFGLHFVISLQQLFIKQPSFTPSVQRPLVTPSNPRPRPPGSRVFVSTSLARLERRYRHFNTHLRQLSSYSLPDFH